MKKTKVYYLGGLSDKPNRGEDRDGNPIPHPVSIYGRVIAVPLPGDFLEMSLNEANYLINRYPPDANGFQPFSRTLRRIEQPVVAAFQPETLSVEELEALLARKRESDEEAPIAAKGVPAVEVENVPVEGPSATEAEDAPVKESPVAPVEDAPEKSKRGGKSPSRGSKGK